MVPYVSVVGKRVLQNQLLHTSEGRVAVLRSEHTEHIYKCHTVLHPEHTEHTYKCHMAELTAHIQVPCCAAPGAHRAHIQVPYG